jgi:hypothetical protein
MQRRIACWAVLGLEIAYEFVEASLVGDVLAGELQYPLTTKGVLERFLADSAFVADKGAFPAGAALVRAHHSGHG